MPTVEAFHVCIPAVEEQRKIVAALSSQLNEVERLSEALEKELASIERLRPTLLQRAFSSDL